MAKRNALGKGLGALIPGADTAPAEKITSEIAPALADQSQRQIIDIPIDDIEPNPHQPRTEFDPKAVGELAQSIREKGIIQPISVRRFGSGYQLIAGERRFRAARQAELEVVPAIVMDVGTDQEMMELSLIENIQRENLSPIEEAKAYRMLIEECFLTQEEVAEHVGKDRSTIANTLRLLALPPEVLDALQAGQISAGHARTLLGLDNADHQIALCQQNHSPGIIGSPHRSPRQSTQRRHRAPKIHATQRSQFALSRRRPPALFWHSGQHQPPRIKGQNRNRILQQ